MLQTSLPTREQVSEALRDVYSRPEFVARPQHSAWDIILKPIGRFFRWLGSLLDGLRGLETSAPWLYWLIMGWLALAAIAILAHLLLTALSALSWWEPRRRRALSVVDPAAPRTAPDWEEEARRAAADGRMRDAAIALYQALVLRLDARGAVRFDPAKTPGDNRREVRRHPDLLSPFTQFLRGFEPVAFGGRSLDLTGYERLRDTAREVGAHG
jgi:hypothetical protein